MKKLLLVVVALLIMFVATAAIAVNYQRPVRTIAAEDDGGALLVYYRLPTRLVVLDAPTGRLLQQLGVAELVVGASDEAATEFPRAEQLGPGANLRPASIVALRPQLVLAGRQSAELVATLRQNGVNVWMTNPASLDALLTGLSRLGKLVGREEQATGLANQLSSQLDSLAAGESRTPVRALFWGDQLFTAAGQGTLESDLLSLAGGSNVVLTEGYSPLPAAEALLLAPEVIFAPEAVLAQTGIPLSPPVTVTGPPNASVAPRLVAIPSDFVPINWENVVARAEWLKQQLLSPAN